MSERILSTRELNRATLARQLLLEPQALACRRATVPAPPRVLGTDAHRVRWS